MDRPTKTPPVDDERRDLLALSPRLLLAAKLSPAAAMLWLAPPRAAAQAAAKAPGVFSLPHEPFLRIEAGMHSALLRRIDTDAGGRYAVTVSDDKTARVWDIATGRLFQVLRPPIGPGNEGKLYAVAMSPDGSSVAVGGWTFLGSSGGTTIYLFDRESGQLQRRLSGLPEVTLHLSFSPDGRWLAATLGGIHGVRVWDWKQSTTGLADSGYGNSSYGASWSADGRLATTSFDGKLRLYRPGDDGRLAKLAETEAPGGKLPYAMAYHPDGSSIAVGYDDSSRVDVVDSQRLLPLFAASTQGVDSGSLSAVAWSRDGRTLVASGRWSRGGRSMARLWPEAGRGQPQDVPLTKGTVMQLAALSTGGWVAGVQDPTWGLLSAHGAWQALGRPPIADLRGSKRDSYMLASAGRRLQFGNELYDTPPLQFDLAHRSLSDGVLPGGKAPDTSALPVLNWENRTDPKLRGQPIKLDEFESSRSLAITPGGQGFALGTDWFLRHYAADGTLRWRQASPGTVWGVNISDDGPQVGQIVVAAYGDGTLRWHRMSDGAELLAFFPHADRRRWVLWTPSGYYDASPGGEELIGWHVNRLEPRGARVLKTLADSPAQRAGLREGDIVLSLDGAPVSGYEDFVQRTRAWPGGGPLRLQVEREGRTLGVDATPAPDPQDRVPRIGVELATAVGRVEASDFFSVGRFRDRFNRPDVIDLVLDTLDEAEAVRRADGASQRTPPHSPFSASFPPAVDVLSGVEVEAQSPRLRVQVRARSALDAPVTGWRVRVNGSLAGDSGSLAAGASLGAAATASFTGRSDEPDIVLTLPPADAEVEVFAVNRFGTSEPATVRVKWIGPAAARPAGTGAQGRLLVLAVGVSEYQHPGVRKLNLAAKDAHDFVAVLRRQQGRQYTQVQERLLPDRHATREAVMDGMAWLQANAGPQDLAVMFIAGHGMNDGARGYTYLPVDADPARLFSTGVPASAIRTVLGGMKGRALFFFDTCHSGGVLAAPTAGSPKPHELQDVNTVINDLSSAENGVTVYSSSGSRQLSLESAEWNNGAFTRAVVEGLGGEAVSKRYPDRITRGSLAVYLSERVAELTGGRLWPPTSKCLLPAGLNMHVLRDPCSSDRGL